MAKARRTVSHKTDTDWVPGIKQCKCGSSSFVSFTQFSPTCGRTPLPALSLWPGRQPCRPRLVDGRRGGGPSSVAPHSRNPPTGCHLLITVNASHKNADDLVIFAESSMCNFDPSYTGRPYGGVAVACRTKENIVYAEIPIANDR